MTQQLINVGTDPNDGTGDPLRTAFEKANDNFTELYNGGGGGGFNGGTITNPLTITSDAENGQGALKLTGAVNPDPSSTGILEIGGLLNFADTDIIASIIHNVDSYAQFVLQNQNSGELASADYIVNNDSPLGTQIYGDFGINSTAFVGSSPFDIANGTYLHSSGGQLAVGTVTDNDILLATDSMLRITVDAAGPVTFAAASPVKINSTQNATSHTTGALVVEGGVGVGGNIVVDTALYVGTAAAAATLGNPTIVAKQSGAEYIQAAIINSSATGSADWVAYANNGTTTHGWADMGFTGSAFNDPAYTIVQEGDGYLFAAGVPDGTGHGSLVLCTHDTGVDNDLVFGTGGFAAANEKMRFKNTMGQFHIQPTTASTSVTTGALRVDGGVGIGGDLYAGNIYSNGVLLTASYSPTTPSDWLAPAPTTIQEAIDRLAAVVKALNGGVGP